MMWNEALFVRSRWQQIKIVPLLPKKASLSRGLDRPGNGFFRSLAPIHQRDQDHQGCLILLPQDQALSELKTDFVMVRIEPKRFFENLARLLFCLIARPVLHLIIFSFGFVTSE